jgi:hypothetical protein
MPINETSMDLTKHASDFCRRARALIYVVVVILQGCIALPANDPGDIVESIFDPRGDLHATDGRAVFRSIFCAINETRGPDLPDHRACSDALRTLSLEQEVVPRDFPARQKVQPISILVVPGFGHECFSDFVGGDGALKAYVESLGHTVNRVDVKGLASSEENAGIIRDSVLRNPKVPDDERLVMIGYSKGANDILAALALYPEVADRVSAVVSVSGAIGGSPLSLHARDWTLGLLAALPGVDCEVPEDTALASLNPATRRAWLADHPLPETVAYFSIVSFPEAARVSAVLRPPFRALAKYDSRNDGQVIVFDQVVPGSEVLAFLNADHWAVALPIARLHPVIGFTGITRNDFPIEVLLEAILEYVDFRLGSGPT